MLNTKRQQHNNLTKVTVKSAGFLESMVYSSEKLIHIPGVLEAMVDAKVKFERDLYEKMPKWFVQFLIFFFCFFPISKFN